MGWLRRSLAEAETEKTLTYSGKFFFTTTSSKLCIVRYRLSLAAMLLLNFVMIH